MRIAFVTNICPHYRVKTFELLAGEYLIDFYFFSAGEEWYWQQQHGVHAGKFHYEYLPGFTLAGTRLTPLLGAKLWRGHYDLFIKCINGRFALPATYAIAKAQRKPFILWTGLWQRLQTPTHRAMFPMVQHIYRHADAIITYGEHVRQYLIREGVTPARIFAAPHAVDNAAYNRSVTEAELAAICERLNIQPEQKVLLYLGRLETAKGLEYLLEAFAGLADREAVLIIAGSGSLAPVLKERAVVLGISHCVRFPGYVPVNEAVLYYALAWVVLLPSYATATIREAWGLVVNEAFNQGTPVIVTDTVGAAAGGLVIDHETGLIIPERNIAALHDAIRLLLDDPGLRHGLGRQARKRVATWDNEQMVQGFTSAIQYVRADKKGIT